MPNNKLRRLNVRLNEQEWDKIHMLSAGTTCRTVSEYARKVLLKKAVNVLYRNQSFDDFEEQMVQLLSELETMGQNIKDLIKKIHPWTYEVDVKRILSRFLDDHQKFIETTETIKLLIEKLADQCDPK